MTLDKKVFLLALAGATALANTACEELPKSCGGDSGSTTCVTHSGTTGTQETTPYGYGHTGITEGGGGSGYSYYGHTGN
jgi:hypothetical protein